MLNVPEIVGIGVGAAGLGGAGGWAVASLRGRRKAGSTESRAALLAERLDAVSDQAQRAVAYHSGLHDDLIGAVEAYLQGSEALQRSLVSELDQTWEDGGARDRLVWAAAADLHVVENLSLVEASDQASTDSVHQWLDELAEGDLLPSQAIERLRDGDPGGAVLEAARAGREHVLPQIQLGLLGRGPIAGGAETAGDLNRNCQEVCDQIVDVWARTITNLFGNTVFGAATAYRPDILADAIHFATTGATISPVQGRMVQLIVRCAKAAQSKLHEAVSQLVPLDVLLTWVGSHWQPLIKLQGAISSTIFGPEDLMAECDELIQAIADGDIAVTASSLEAVGKRHGQRNKGASICGRGLRYFAHSAVLHPVVLIPVAGVGLLVSGLTTYLAQDYLDWPPVRFLPDLAVGVRRTLGAPKGGWNVSEQENWGLFGPPDSERH